MTNEPGPLTNVPRWFGQGTLLPTGEVLITSGAKNDEVVVPGAELPVKTPEIYNPETNEFTAMAEPERERTYHNNAVLLSGRHRSGRWTLADLAPATGCSGTWSPVSRRTTTRTRRSRSSTRRTCTTVTGRYIDSVQGGIKWGEDFTIETDDAAEISKVTLMRMPAPQHVHVQRPAHAGAASHGGRR